MPYSHALFFFLPAITPFPLYSHHCTRSGSWVSSHSSHVCTQSLLPSFSVNLCYSGILQSYLLYHLCFYLTLIHCVRVMWVHSCMLLYVNARPSCFPDYKCEKQLWAHIAHILQILYTHTLVCLSQVPVMMQWAVQWCSKSSILWPTSPLLYTMELSSSLMGQRKISCR